MGPVMRQNARLERWKSLWCGMMHDSLTWPRNGHYRCLKCGRTYLIPWAQAHRPLLSALTPVKLSPQPRLAGWVFLTRPVVHAPGSAASTNYSAVSTNYTEPQS